MLHYIIGPAKSGKTTQLDGQIEALAAKGERRIILLVPEQATFETEKRLFCRLGGERFRRVDVTSFTRLAQEAFRLYGGIAGQYADDCAKQVLMERAVAELADQLDVCAKSAKSRTFPSEMLETVKEFKNAGLSPEELTASAELLGEGRLADKVRETALLYSAYDALLKQAYRDPLDDISRAVRLLADKDSLNGTAVFLDEFKGFTAAEAAFIRLLLKKAADVTVALCVDWERAERNPSGLFSSQLAVYERLNLLARKENVPVQSPVKLTETYFAAPGLAHMEKNLFAPVIAPYSGESRAVSCVLCRNEYGEAEYAAAAIAALVQEEGCRYNDIAVISRDLDTYLPKLDACFSRYGISYYADVAAPVTDKPLIRFVRNVLDCLTNGFSGENVLAALKCGVTPFSVEDVAELENYVYVWRVAGAQWRVPFTANPRGFQEELTEEDAAALERMNRLREQVSGCLDELREAAKDRPAREICAALFAFLEKLGVQAEVERIIREAYDRGETAQAGEYGRVWDILMELLDTLVSAAGSRPLRPAEFERLFLLAASSYDMGTLPQAADTVIVGSADRIRTAGKRAVLVLGVNEGVMPYVPKEGGMFTDRERERLFELEIELSKSSREKLREERFIAYKTLTSPTERLILTARKADISGEAKAPSALFAQLRRMFGPEALTDAEDLDGAFFCRSPGAAFSRLAETYRQDTPLNAALRELLQRDSGYAPKLEGLSRAFGERTFHLRERRNADGLFGKVMNISPTRVEGFYQCRFRYFLEHGIKARPLRRADLDPLEAGTLVHHILYEVTRQVDLKEDYNPEQVRELIRRELDRYIDTVMGGQQDKTNRFLYLYNRMRLTILKIVDHLHEELAQSGFDPCAFELEIAPGAEVTPLRLTGEDGTVVNVFGKIDRADVYKKKNGEKYVRIVDYKTGKKEFRLNDVLYGLNLQMLIYLQCISQNGGGRFAGTLPAGILYMPAAQPRPGLERDADEAAIQKERQKAYAMNGLLIEDGELLAAMDASMKGIFIPVTASKDGDFTKASRESLVSLTELSRINAYIDKLIVGMADELHAGRIEAVPAPGGCDYCGYRSVCGAAGGAPARGGARYSRDEALREMERALSEGSGPDGGKEDKADGEN